MFKTFPVVLDITKHQLNDMFQVNSNDLNTIKLNMSIKSGMDIFDLTGKIVRIAVKKPDGFIAFQTGGVIDPENGLCEFILDKQAYLVEGKHEAEVMIYQDDSTVIVTERFYYKVNRAIVNDKTLLSTNHMPAISQAIIAGEQLQNIDIPEFVEAANGAFETIENAEVQGTYAKDQGDYAKQKGDIAAQRVTELNGVDAVQFKDRQDQFDKKLGSWVDITQPPYNAKGDGVADDTTAIRNAINSAIATRKKLFSPTDLIFKVTGSLTIPDGLKIDFSGSTISAISNISTSVLVLDGSDIDIENMKLLQSGYNYNAVGDSNGISVQSAKNVNNIKLRNIETTGFNNGINIYPAEGFLANKVRVENCTTNYAEMAGINISNARDVSVLNHYATYNALDGLKTTKNAKDVRIQGGYFSYNRDPIGTYADGIDLYGGGNDVVVSGAICENNGGVGIHILSGELQDINYQNPAWTSIKNIIIDNCICRNNVGAGMDVTTKLTVSATSPYPSKIIFKGCVSYNNEYGINVKARHVTFSDCIFSNNLKHGMDINDSIYIAINNCQNIKNSASSATTYAGIKLKGCKHITIKGGVINGSDSDVMQQEDGSVLTIYHLYGIWIDNCDHVFVDVPSIVNYTSGRGVYVASFNLIENANKVIVVKIGDIGTKPLNNQIGYKGSSLYKQGIWYVKKTDLNSVVWDEQDATQTFINSPDGSRYKITVGNDGALTTTKL